MPAAGPAPAESLQLAGVPWPGGDLAGGLLHRGCREWGGQLLCGEVGRLGLRLIHLPVHASWLNQVEIYFSVVQRKVVSPNDFPSLSDVESRLLDLQQHYEQIATPFEWKFTKNDLNALLERIAAHDHADRTLAA